jgi:hypothetical protein
MPFNPEAWRREILRHCLWLASKDPDYAQWAAERYERESCGALVGLGDKVRQAIEKRAAKQPARE